MNPFRWAAAALLTLTVAMTSIHRPHLAFADGLDLADEADVRWGVAAYAEARGQPFDGYTFDQDVAASAILFFPRYCRLTKAEFAGRPFVLKPWQAFDIIAPAFGWKAPDGTRRFRRAEIWVPKKNGKAISLDTPIPTPSGWARMGDIETGCQVFAADGSACRVTAESPVLLGRECFEVLFSNGERIVADSDHLWLTHARVNEPGRGTRRGLPQAPSRMTRVRSTREIAASLRFGPHGDANHSVAMPQALAMPPADLPVHPYVLGAWLGDGNSRCAALTVGGQDLEFFTATFAELGLKVSVTAERTCWRLAFGALGANLKSPANVWAVMRRLGLEANKHIPRLYLRASRDQRLALLHGLMDTDGYCALGNKILELSTVSPALSRDYAELLASLGVKFSIRETPLRCNGRPVAGTSYRLQFWMDTVDLPAFKMPRKLERQRAMSSPSVRLPRSRTVQITDVRPIPSVPVKCIAVDHPSWLYLAGRTMLPTHNTELMGGVSLAHIIGDEEFAGEGYAVAVKEDQARIVFDVARRMIVLNAALRDQITVFKDSIWFERLQYSFRPLGGRAEGTHGKGPSFRIADEVHEFRDDRLLQFLDTGMASRRQPMAWSISTAGLREGYGWELFESSRHLVEGTISDSRTLAVIYAAGEEDDPWSPATWEKANPNYGVSVKREFMADEAQKARRSARHENDFKRYHLNLWVGQAKRWLRPEDWKACGANAGPNAWKTDFEDLRGRRCFMGVDMGSTQDLCAESMVFPPAAGDGWRALFRFWLPSHGLEDRVRHERVPYDIWAHEGAVTLTPGNAADHTVIEKQIRRDMVDYDVQRIGFDPWNALAIMTSLNAERPEDEPIAYKVNQTIAGMTGGAKLLERLVLAHGLDHGNHPVARWMAANVGVASDGNDNLKPMKNRSGSKIDGIVALINALVVSQGGEAAAPESYLVNSGLMVA